MRILFALSGAHRVNRGAEVAFESVARHLATSGHGDEVVVIGSGPQRANEPYGYEQAKVVPRERFERFPSFPMFRNNEMWEEFTFVPGLRRRFRRRDFDITVTCGFPYTNLTLRRRRSGTPGARHVWVSQNGIWPVSHPSGGEARLFGADGLVCINPEHFEIGSARFPAALIPNGVDIERFVAGPGDRARFGIPEGVPVVLMVSALIASKRVEAGIRAVAALPDAVLVVAGDGILRREIDALADRHLPGRFRRVSVSIADMPELYRCADAFLHLSLDESFGNVYVEAMVTGLPCVAHDCSHTRWIYGEHAILVDSMEPAQLTAGLARALASAGDDRSAQIAAGRERFWWKHIAQQYRDFFVQLS